LRKVSSILVKNTIAEKIEAIEGGYKEGGLSLSSIL